MKTTTQAKILAELYDLGHWDTSQDCDITTVRLDQFETVAYRTELISCNVTVRNKFEILRAQLYDPRDNETISTKKSFQVRIGKIREYMRTHGVVSYNEVLENEIKKQKQKQEKTHTEVE